VDRARQQNYHERTGHVLPEQNNLLQFYIRDAEQFVSENLMVLNKYKTKVMSFTKSRKWDFPTEVSFSDRTPLECIPDTRLVGVVISQDLKWFKNTAYICEKARGKLWILRRMLKVNLDGYQLFDVYTKEMEMAVPVWHSGLSKKQTADIESIQKLAMKIILQENYSGYAFACEKFGTQTLEERRIKLCYKFATKNHRSDNSFFTRLSTTVETRNKSDIVREFKCNFGRFQDSSLPYLAKLINSKK
jgi:hypothetical protein